MGLPPRSHQALLAAVRSGDSATVRGILADAEASGTSLAALAEEATLFVAKEAEREEVVRLILSIYDFKARSELDLDAFYLAATPGYIGRPPYFDGTNYSSWKHRMKVYLKAIHPSFWQIVEKGYTVKDIHDEHKNAQAANLILSSLSPKVYHPLYGLESAKEMWDALELAHEGSPSVRESKIELLLRKLERFVMKEGEAPKEMYDRLIPIVNEVKALGSKKMADTYVVRRLLGAIIPRNHILLTIIHNREDFAELKPHDVFGEFLAHEMEQESKELRALSKQSSSSSSKKRDPTLKARKEAKESSSEDSEDEDDMALLQKRLKEILKREGKSKERHSRRPCYECGATGHFMANCPNKKNKGIDEKRENHSKNKIKSHKNSQNQKGQADIRKGWDSSDSDTDSD